MGTSPQSAIILSCHNRILHTFQQAAFNLGSQTVAGADNAAGRGDKNGLPGRTPNAGQYTRSYTRISTIHWQKYNRKLLYLNTWRKSTFKAVGFKKSIKAPSPVWSLDHTVLECTRYKSVYKSESGHFPWPASCMKISNPDLLSWSEIGVNPGIKAEKPLP
jgi:hypothetical protein